MAAAPKGFNTLTKWGIVAGIVAGAVFSVSVWGINASTFLNISLPLRGEGTTLDDDLVLHYTFDQPDMLTSVSDLSGNGYHGNISGQTSTTTIPGAVGQALFFDGIDDYIKPLPGYDVSNDAVTLASWVKVATTTNGTAMNIINKRSTLYYLFVASNGLPGVKFVPTSHPADPSYIQISGTTNMRDGNWHHILATWENGEAKLYVDGLLEATDSHETPTLNAGTAIINIGGYVYGECPPECASWYHGALDDVRIYNRALDEEEVSQLYHMGATSKLNVTQEKGGEGSTLEDNLVGHYTFDGNDMVSYVADSSGQGNHGYLSGFSATTTEYGRIGQALRKAASASQSVTLPHIDFANRDFSIGIWFKSPTLETTATRLLGQTDTSCSPNHCLHFSIRTKKLYMGFFNDDVPGTTNLSNNRWYHAVFTYDADTNLGTLYLDGVVDATRTFTNDYQGGSGATFVGSHCCDSDAAATFDDVRIYHRTLSASEALQLYRIGATTKVNVTQSKGSTGSTLEESLIGHWSFDGNRMIANVADSSGNGNNGRLSGFAATTTTYGRIGQALQFDGTDDAVVVPDADDLLDIGTRDFTLMAWVKGNAMAAGDVIVGKSNGGGASATYGFHFSAYDTLQPTLHFATAGTALAKIQAATSLADGSWYHVVVAVDRDDSSNTKMYINGTADTTSVSNLASNTGAIANTAALSIGAESDGGFYWDGAIDDARIYTRRLTAEEIAEVYRLGR